MHANTDGVGCEDDVSMIGPIVGKSRKAQADATCHNVPVGFAGPSNNMDLPNFGVVSSSDVSNALKRSSAFPVLHKGLDTGEWSLRVEADELSSVLDMVVPLIGMGEQKVDGRSFVVSRIGGLTHRFLLRFPDGVEVRLPDYDFQRYGIRVKLGAKSCVLEESPEQYVIELLAWLLVCRRSRVVDALRLVRADICMDVLMLEKDFQSMCRRVAMSDTSVVSRAREMKPYIEEGRYTGFTAGQNAVMLRCYDKKTEAVKGKDWSFWSSVYGRGEEYQVPDGYAVVRLEWQLRREFLGSFREDDNGSVVLPDGITSLDVLWAVSGNVLAYLCGQWFRFAGAPSGASHERRAVPLWRRVSAAFLSGEWSRFSPGLRRRLKRHVAVNVSRLAEMALGCMASIAAALGHQEGRNKPLDYREVSIMLRRHVGPEKQKWLTSARRRYDALPYGANWRGVPVSPVGY